MQVYNVAFVRIFKYTELTNRKSQNMVWRPQGKAKLSGVMTNNLKVKTRESGKF